MWTALCRVARRRSWFYIELANQPVRAAMTARIFKPSKTAMQSGLRRTKDWALEFEPEEPRSVEPLMGWTSSGDMRQQLRLRFHTKEEAVAYCEKRGIAYLVTEDTPAPRKVISYSDNFGFKRRDAWTH
jgi:ETC complex I subunit-like protein